ncbi:hypothetical protein LEP1GSC058_3926 [Leptospira fainei serovar Hurstbridge str. BUT 6]|uniref:Cytidylyltransferase n=1 Tax=Leptospira fainei serovar Hurstbridge str. BUT 6 TaxID=1193011 RepID=S3V910_9LEPT|nr:hypothetical protein [Leptospira fainei]EPG72905.1 hypothetical protein LEP1GSC058_3926 [Leptospira fainei serovar Hurstbridge str. BUT 6]
MSGTLLTRKKPGSLYAFIQARTSSTRLPGKVLKELPKGSGNILLDHIHFRLGKVLPQSRIVYLIPEGDSELETFLTSRKRQVFPGPLEDVRARYILAASKFNAQAILRLTGDNPFYDVKHLSLLLLSFLEGTSHLSYVRGLPLGTGGEVFRTEALLWEPESGLEERHKEHVSLHIKENPEKFRITSIPSLIGEKGSDRVPHFRLTVDTMEDFRTMEAILEGPAKSIPNTNTDVPDFGVEDLLRWETNFPKLFQGNANVPQIKFSLPTLNRNTKGKVALLIAPSKEFGSGHEARSHILYSMLPDRDWEPVLVSEFPKDDEYQGLIIDYRDISIPIEYKKTKLLLLDHFGIERKIHPHFDLLPHPLNRGDFDWNHILLPPSLTSQSLRPNEDEVKQYEFFCYAGAIEKKKCDDLDEILVRQSESGNILRVGGTPPAAKNPRIEYVDRLSANDYLTAIRGSKRFFGYFGQSLFEALYLGIPSATFGISPIHETLSSIMEEDVGIPYYKNKDSLEFSIGTKTPGEKGYENILEYIDFIFHSEK